MSEAHKKLIETVAATIGGDLSNKLDVLEQDIRRRNSVVNELDKHEADARKKLEGLYAEITAALAKVKKAESEVTAIQSAANSSADKTRAAARAEALATKTEATRDADRITEDARKLRDTLATDILQKKSELTAIQAAVDAAKTELAVMKQQARKFADG